MTTFVLGRSDVTEMLSHMALYGLGAILDDAGVRGVRVSWSGGMQPRPQVDGADLTDDMVGEAVRQHAAARVADSWVQEDVTLGGKPRGLMSPRLSTFTGGDFDVVQQRRHGVLERLTDRRAHLDLRMLAALGEPAYWRHNAKGEPLQDDGATRWDMQPRNQGSELVKTRLRKLANAVAAKDADTVAAGLRGERGDGEAAPGLLSGNRADSAVSWCAVWGVSQLPLAVSVRATAVTTGHLGRSRQEWYYAPYWTSLWRSARLRSVLAAAPLKVAASHGLVAPWDGGDSQTLAARAWLCSRGVTGIVRFPIQRFGSDSAPERRAMLGTPLPTSPA